MANTLSPQNIANLTENVQRVGHNGPATFVQEHSYLVSAAALLLALYFMACYFSPKVDANEPPEISHPIPLVGHLISVMIKGLIYFDEVGARTQQPISTIPILGSKVYVISSPDLVTACMRETRTLSFNPFIVEVVRRFVDLPLAEMEVTKFNMDSKTEAGYLSDMHRSEHATLAPGPGLDKMYENVLSEMSGELQTLSDDLEVDFYHLLRRKISISAIRACYGPENPFDREPTLVDDFWDFEHDLKWLLVNTCPSLMVPKAHEARSRLKKAFSEYYQQGAYQQACAMVRDRYTIAIKHGQSMEAIAGLEVGMLFGILANATPTVFWMLSHILSDSSLLQAIIDETAHMLTTDSIANSICIDLRSDKHIRAVCPLLTSTFHETLRVIASSLSSGRAVLQDTVLTDATGTRSYVLKAGNTVQIPSHSLHHPPPSNKTSPFAQGVSHEEFDPYRFSSLGPKLASEPERSMNGSFRAFGGGSVLCPGRKFAFVEVVGFVVLFVTSFEVLDFEMPPVKNGKVSFAVAKPPLGVTSCRIRRREEVRGKLVRVEMSGARRDA